MTLIDPKRRAILARLVDIPFAGKALAANTCVTQRSLPLEKYEICTPAR